MTPHSQRAPTSTVEDNKRQMQVSDDAFIARDIARFNHADDAGFRPLPSRERLSEVFQILQAQGGERARLFLADHPMTSDCIKCHAVSHRSDGVTHLPARETVELRRSALGISS